MATLYFERIGVNTKIVSAELAEFLTAGGKRESQSESYNIA